MKKYGIILQALGLFTEGIGLYYLSKDSNFGFKFVIAGLVIVTVGLLVIVYSRKLKK